MVKIRHVPKHQQEKEIYFGQVWVTSKSKDGSEAILSPKDTNFQATENNAEQFFNHVIQTFQMFRNNNSTMPTTNYCCAQNQITDITHTQIHMHTQTQEFMRLGKVAYVFGWQRFHYNGETKYRYNIPLSQIFSYTT